MSKTLLAMLATASILSFGTVQAADTAAPMDQPASEAAKPANMTKHHKIHRHHKKAMHHHHKKAMKSAVGSEPSGAVKP